MRNSLRARHACARLVAAVSALLLAGAAYVAGAPPVDAATGYVCSGGSPTSPTLIPPGHYGPLTVTGSCYMQGTYTISGGLTVAPGAELDAAVFFGFPPYDYGAPCNVFVSVSGGVRVGQGGVLYLGNSGDTSDCANSNDVVNGGISANGAETVVVHGTRINGGFNVTGGGGGTSCEGTNASPFAPYTNLEDSSVGGGVNVTGLSTCWIGLIRTNVSGGMRVVNDTLGDPDAIEIGMNTISGGLACSGNALAFPGPGGVPTDFFDGGGPFPNTVTGQKTGQCAGL